MLLYPVIFTILFVIYLHLLFQFSVFTEFLKNLNKQRFSQITEARIMVRSCSQFYCAVHRTKMWESSSRYRLKIRKRHLNSKYCLDIWFISTETTRISRESKCCYIKPRTVSIMLCCCSALASDKNNHESASVSSCFRNFLMSFIKR